MTWSDKSWRKEYLRRKFTEKPPTWAKILNGFSSALYLQDSGSVFIESDRGSILKLQIIQIFTWPTNTAIELATAMNEHLPGFPRALKNGVPSVFDCSWWGRIGMLCHMYGNVQLFQPYYVPRFWLLVGNFHSRVVSKSVRYGFETRK